MRTDNFQKISIQTRSKLQIMPSSIPLFFNF